MTSLDLSHHSKMPFIHFECTSCFFDKVFRISHPYFEISGIAARIVIICCKYSLDGSINRNMNLFFENVELGYMDCFDIHYYAFAFCSGYPFNLRLVQK